MRPPGQRRGPNREERAAESLVATTDNSEVTRYGRRPQVYTPRPSWTQWRGTQAKKSAAVRCEPLACGRRNPEDVVADVVTGSTIPFGLTAEQRDAERRRLLGMGWTPGEVNLVLGAAS